MIVSAASAVESLTALAQPWADRVADSSVLATTIIVVHVVAIFAAGGLAVAADRAVLRATRVPSRDAGTAGAAVSDELRHTISELGATHGPVIVALTFAFASGLLLLLSDVGTFAVSRVFWSKLALIILLLANGIRLRRAEARLMQAKDGNTVTVGRALRTLRGAAGFSLFAWFGIVLLGAILGNA